MNSDNNDNRTSSNSLPPKDLLSLTSLTSKQNSNINTNIDSNSVNTEYKSGNRFFTNSLEPKETQRQQQDDSVFINGLPNRIISQNNNQTSSPSVSNNQSVSQNNLFINNTANTPQGNVQNVTPSVSNSQSASQNNLFINNTANTPQGNVQNVTPSVSNNQSASQNNLFINNTANTPQGNVQNVTPSVSNSQSISHNNVVPDITNVSSLVNVENIKPEASSINNENSLQNNTQGIKPEIINSLSGNNKSTVKNQAPSVSNNQSISQNNLFINNTANTLQNNNQIVDSIGNDISSLPKTNNYNATNNADKLSVDELMKMAYTPKVALEYQTRKENKWLFGVTITAGIIFIFVLAFAIVGKGNVVSFAGGSPYYQDKKIETNGDTTMTAVVTDNIYKNVEVTDSASAKNLIVKDSENQKSKCSNAKVKEIENRMQKNYGIVAVNLCELDYNYAKNLEKTLKKVYKEFPFLKSYLTNLTIKNFPEDEGGENTIAAYNPAMIFVENNSLFKSGQNVYKMSISLNSYHFLNLDDFIQTVELGAGSMYIDNANEYSVVAHEFGHYLSFIAQLKNAHTLDSVLILNKKNRSQFYNLIKDSNEYVFTLKMLKEALNNYNDKYGDALDLEEFRSQISGYAGVEGLYDETIAEAYHDYFVNGKNAKNESLEIVKVLKKYLNTE